jgi:hypothetical protein
MKNLICLLVDRWTVLVVSLIIVIVSLLSFNLTAQEGASNPSFFFTDAVTRVFQDDIPGTNFTITIYTAKNEYEPFQVVLYGGAKGLKNVSVSFSPLTNKNGFILNATNVFAYREHYVEIKTNSPKSTLKPGWYPDALIPLVNPYTGKPLKGNRFDGMPFDVLPMKNQPIWVEVYIPSETSPGDYIGKIIINADGFSTTLFYKVIVWKFTLPERPSLRSNFGGFGTRMARGHKVEQKSELFRTLEFRYSSELAKHRISPLIPSYLMPRINQDGSINIDTDSLNILKKWMNDFHITGFPLNLIGTDPLGKDRERTTRYLRQMYEFLKTNGWEKLAYIYVLDEPNDQAAYEQVRQRAKLIHESQPGIKVLCTEQPVPQKSEWGTLVGSVDIWVPLWPLFEEKSVAERLVAGEEVWSYTALCQGAKGRDTPFWQIDFPLLNYRIFSWISFRYGLNGILYWTTVYWEKAGDVWTNPQTYRDFNGEGSLFYPGLDVGLDGPVTSIRLKQIREGIEDFEYLKLLASTQPEKAKQLVLKIARSWTDWEKEPQKLYSVRYEIGKLLSK